MRIFNLDKRFSVVCDSKSTRSGFKHTATLTSGGYSVCDTKICYLNRTWEGFGFETVLKKIVNLNFKEKELVKHLKTISTFV